jgi:hypothetical protein
MPTPLGDALFNDHPLAHSMPGAGVVHHIIRVDLTIDQPLPIYPDQRTSSDRPDWSGSCQERK